MTNEVYFENDSLNGMMKGLGIGARSVGLTMGYFGKTVFIHKQGFNVEATKDGVTVINSIRLEDTLEDAGLKFLQDISSKTAGDSGDGTSTVCVLTHEMILQGLKLKLSGINTSELKIGMERALASVVSTLNSIKKNVGNDKKVLKQIACVSANNDNEIGELIGGIYERFGKNASIQVEDANSNGSHVDLINGYQFLGGYFNQYYVNTKNNTAELSNPYILIVDGKVEKTSEITPIIEKVVSVGRSLVIIADDFSQNTSSDIVKTITNNKSVKIYLLKQEFGGETKDELLLDLCAATGSTLVTPKTGKKIENIDMTFLGECEKIKSTKSETTIYNGRSSKKELALRIDDVNKKIKDAKNLMLREKYELRLAKLLGGVAIYYVGGATHAEIGEKMARIDDAIRSTRCAIEDGICPGGGTALIRCIDNLSKLSWKTSDEKAGIYLVQKSIEKPLFQIVSNSGKSGELMVEKVKERKGAFGYNCKTDKIEDLFKSGIIDPVKVVRVCMENSVSGAIQFLISECAIVDKKNINA